MRDLDRALADIAVIRSHMARGVVFRGLGPATLALTGVLAFVVASAQALWIEEDWREPLGFFLPWIATAFVALGLIGMESVTRSRRIHSDLADELVLAAIEGFLPVLAAGALIAVVLWRVDPSSLWLMPGLWQVLVGLGVFGAARLLPRGLVVAGAWYVVAGLVVLALAAPGRTLSPWLMGLPFAIGQLLVAGLLQFGSGGGDERA